MKKNKKYDSVVALINDYPWLAGLTPEAFAQAMARLTRKPREDGLSGDMTLTEFYWTYYRENESVANHRTRGTMRERETALKYWKECTGDPPMNKITRKTTNLFVMVMRRVMYRGKPLSEDTIYKHRMALASVLNVAGPRQPKYPDALHLIKTPPGWPEITRNDDISWKTPGLEELERILVACDVAHKPELPQLTAPEWWRGIYRFLYNTGVRKSDAMNACWKDIRRMNGQVVLVISCKGEKVHREKFIPLNTAAQEVLNSITHHTDDDKIFPFPMSDAVFHRQRRAILSAANLPNLTMGTFHGVRRLVGTVVDDAQLVLGHTSGVTTRKHYQATARKAAALERLKQPRKCWNTEKEIWK